MFSGKINFSSSGERLTGDSRCQRLARRILLLHVPPLPVPNCLMESGTSQDKKGGLWSVCFPFAGINRIRFRGRRLLSSSQLTNPAPPSSGLFHSFIMAWLNILPCATITVPIFSSGFPESPDARIGIFREWIQISRRGECQRQSVVLTLRAYSNCKGRGT